MILDNVISKQWVNDNIRPCSINDTTFYGCVNEVLLLDVSDKLNNQELIDELKSNEISTETEEYLSKGLRDAIGYYVLYRAYRTASVTLTKYGATVKNSDDSTPATNAELVSNSNYFKDMADRIMMDFIANCPCVRHVPTTPSFARCKVVGN